MVTVGVYREYDMKLGIFACQSFWKLKVDTNLLAAERTAERVGWWGYIKESSDM